MADTAREIHRRLLAECDRVYDEVCTGHSHGHLIGTGILRARIALEALPVDELDAEQLFASALGALEVVRARLDDPGDDDGFALGGAGTVVRLVEEERARHHSLWNRAGAALSRALGAPAATVKPVSAETREIQSRILDECDRQYDSVRFTHEFGKWIGRGISASRSAISSIPTDIPPLEFLRRCLSILESVRAVEDSPNDEDGWTGGGISTIARFVLQERVAVERANASSREGILQAVDEAVRDAMPDRHEVLRRQVSILLLDALEQAEPRLGCSWCRKEAQTHRFDSMRSICLTCALLFHANLAEAAHGKQIPEIGMVIADVSRALRAANEPAAERIVAELERRASARRSRHPRGFLPSCDGCTQAFERCQWTASLPGIDLCDRCVKHATEVLSFR